MLSRGMRYSGVAAVNSKPIQASARPLSDFRHGAGVRCVVVTALLALLLAVGCGRGTQTNREYSYVSVPVVNLRDRVAAVYNRTGTAKNGERLEVLERNKRFVRVRTDSGLEGWVEERYLVSENIYQGFVKLAKDAERMPAQGHALTRASVNMHITPGRDSERLYQLREGERLDLLKRGVGEKPGARIVQAPPAAKKPGSKSVLPLPTGPAMEDWWLVRDPERHAGWVLGRMLDLDIPMEIAQYGEGQRIVAAFVLNTVNDPQYEPKKDDDEEVGTVSEPSQSRSAPATQNGATVAQAGDPHIVPQYLVLMSEPKDGLPFDYNQVRVFTWNLRRHRYETAYRERNLAGVLPVTVGSAEFEKEGTLPIFTLQVKDDGGQTQERKYKLNGPMVRRVLAPGEQPQHAARPARSSATQKRRRR
jgi:SH3-like domain-containing protein